jgi:hypothetical protein
LPDFDEAGAIIGAREIAARSGFIQKSDGEHWPICGFAASL